MGEDYMKYDGRVYEPPYDTGPAPKEEEMETTNPKCNQCSDRLCLYEIERGICQQCIDKKEARTAERRALCREAYMAALGGASQHIGETEKAIVTSARDIALETVRRWDAFMATVDAEGGE